MHCGEKILTLWWNQGRNPCKVMNNGTRFVLLSSTIPHGGLEHVKHFHCLRHSIMYLRKRQLWSVWMEEIAVYGWSGNLYRLQQSLSHQTLISACNLPHVAHLLHSFLLWKKNNPLGAQLHYKISYIIYDVMKRLGISEWVHLQGTSTTDCPKGILSYSSGKSIRTYICIVLNGEILSDCNENGMAVF